MIIAILRKKPLMPQCVEKEEGGDLRERQEALRRLGQLQWGWRGRKLPEETW